MIYKRELSKPDGRRLVLYARTPLPDGIAAPSPLGHAAAPNPHLRWHPLRGEWVVYAGHRQQRPFLPPAEYDPLGVTRDPAQPTELPAGDWEVAVFENMFPSLVATAHDPPALSIDTAAARGACEVVVFTQDPRATLGSLSVDRVALIVDVWADRYEALGRRSDVAYVFVFENRGAEVGATQSHAHGQIYGYPFVPPIAQRELDLQRAHLRTHGRGLLETIVAREAADGARAVYAGPHVLAFVPVFARYAYEVWLAPRRPAPSFAALTRDERRDLSRALKTVVMKYDGLWQRPFPYVLVFHQAPTDGAEHPEAHLHAELYPAYRMPDRLKHLAGSELGAGVFTADTLPEDAARALQGVPISLDDDDG